MQFLIKNFLGGKMVFMGGKLGVLGGPLVMGVYWGVMGALPKWG